MLPIVDPCSFCNVEPGRIWLETEHAFALPAASPVADGHGRGPAQTISTIYELAMPEQQALWELVGEVRSRLLTGLTPDGFSIGFNDTMHDRIGVDHAAVHVVPRRRGGSPDRPDGVEWVTDDHVAAWR